MKNNNSGGDTSDRGFASMDEDKQRETTRKGGEATHQQGTAHEFTPEEAGEKNRAGQSSDDE